MNDNHRLVPLLRQIFALLGQAIPLLDPESERFHAIQFEATRQGLVEIINDRHEAAR